MIYPLTEFYFHFQKNLLFFDIATIQHRWPWIFWIHLTSVSMAQGHGWPICRENETPRLLGQRKERTADPPLSALPKYHKRKKESRTEDSKKYIFIFYIWSFSLSIKKPLEIIVVNKHGGHIPGTVKSFMKNRRKYETTGISPQRTQRKNI